MQLLRAAGAAALIGLLGCSSLPDRPDLQHSTPYAKDGVSFRLPGNWKVTAETLSAGDRQGLIMFIESPGAPLFGIQRFIPARSVPLETHAAQVLHELLAGTNSIAMEARTKSWTPIRGRIAGEEVDGLEILLDVSLLGVQIPHRIRFYQIQKPGSTYYFMLQAAIEDWDIVLPGFELITGSLDLQ